MFGIIAIVFFRRHVCVAMSLHMALTKWSSQSFAIKTARIAQVSASSETVKQAVNTFLLPISMASSHKIESFPSPIAVPHVLHTTFGTEKYPLCLLLQPLQLARLNFHAAEFYLLGRYAAPRTEFGKSCMKAGKLGFRLYALDAIDYTNELQVKPLLAVVSTLSLSPHICGAIYIGHVGTWHMRLTS